jgi:hypothetical protein
MFVSHINEHCREPLAWLPWAQAGLPLPPPPPAPQVPRASSCHAPKQ